MARNSLSARPSTAAEWANVKRTIAEHGGNLSEAARALGVDPRTMRRWVKDRPELQEKARALRAKAGVSGPR